MSYLTRLFCPGKKRISAQALKKGIANEPLGKLLNFEDEKTNTNNQIIIRKKNLELLIIIELLPQENQEDKLKLKNIIEYSKTKLPGKNMKWVKKYISKSKYIYEFIPLFDFRTEKDFEILTLIQREAWVYSRGIFQFFGEGFTNESGDLVLWDYPFSITGKRFAAIKDFTKRWKTFEMTLESLSQRKYFFKGKVPKHSKLIFRG
ncbi:MAG: hypothetical protein RBR53_05000 [Desulforegulaceae bacterium]|nr:hypothetical protein [Desulforegulaceae bacterium]